jgi:UDP-2,3-diacylglucosamine pyrophosphatase LpxH
LVAGDVSQSLQKLEEVLRHLANIFNAVYFVPGNHDLYVTAKVRWRRVLLGCEWLCDATPECWLSLRLR